MKRGPPKIGIKAPHGHLLEVFEKDQGESII